MRKNSHYPDMDGKKTEDFIWEKISQEADAYEAELNADASLDDVRLTPEMMDDMMRRIAEEDERNAKSAEMFLSEDDREALRLGREERERRTKRKKSRKVLLRAGIVAAILVIAFGAGMTIEANRIRLLNAWNFLQGKEIVIRVENDEEVGEYGVELENACADILDKTGIHSVWFPYMPKGMQFHNYVINDTSEYALMFYEYGDTIITVDMEKNNERVKKSQIFDGEVLKNFDVESKFGNVSVTEILTPEGEKDYIAQIVYGNCRYTIYGVLSQEELTKIIEKINFY
ncbi:putative phage tail component domain protein [Marvinbryantia formatexigens DSM 14469]|uniref:Phage tail component domain protein n=3 Tax=Marvinbryantia TaxID=248744 RepID=C6LI37_9FIRM|nr:putative phage tail component domain protein [Marvinbryantia formatexigens DSM 14469]SDG45521.1 protein of unknown function [Marvinbryantia formatexigens]